MPPGGSAALQGTGERELTGRMAGLLYLTAGLTAPLILLLPGTETRHWRAVVALAGLAVAWAIVSLFVIEWEAGWPRLAHPMSVAGVALSAAGVALSGGAQAPTRFYLFFVVVYAACFFRRRTALLYVVVCGAAHALPLLYTDGPARGRYLGELAVVLPTYFALGALISAGRGRLDDLHEEQERHAAEQGALRRVATAVAEAGHSAEHVFALVARESAKLLGANAAGILRFEGTAEARVIGSWSDGSPTAEPGTLYALPAESELAVVRRTGRPLRVDSYPDDTSRVSQLGYEACVIAPVRMGEELWGGIALTTLPGRSFAPGAEERLARFAGLLELAIANAESKQRLTAQASSDALTGLLNHRSFHERLRSEVARAVRHDRELSLAVIDVDSFKRINDEAGHEAGDRVLSEIAALLVRSARAGDVVARIGGDEFALLLPETTRMDAYLVAEAARQTVSSTELADGVHVTVSAGVCDLGTAPDAEAMFRLADGALYWSKAHGRDVCWIYDPDVVPELTARERADRLERSHALLGMRGLARAIDAKDPNMRRHSERVAELACLLAERLEWPPERRALLREAALVHDVGKIGIPDAILLKPARLDERETAAIRQHPALGAQIVADLLDPEQVQWIHSHHERPDGAGYPDGLRASEIPLGAALIAVADAWDAMMVSRVYADAREPGDALAECVRLAGRQFDLEVVEALRTVLALEAGRSCG